MPRMTIVLLTALCLTIPARAETKPGKPGTTGGGGSGSDFKPPVVEVAPGGTGHTGLDKAGPNERNIIVEVGGSAVGSEEDKYAKNLHEIVGGALFNGSFTMQALIDYIIAEAKAGRKIANIYLVGHIMLMHDNDANRAAFQPNVPPSVGGFFGFLHFGQPAGDPETGRMGNLGNPPAFIDLLDKALAAAGLKYSDVFSENCRIVARVCETENYMAAFWDALALRLPAGASITTYTSPYFWSTSSYFAGIRYRYKFLMDEQAAGRTTRNGQNLPPALPKPPAKAIPAPAAPPMASRTLTNALPHDAGHVFKFARFEADPPGSASLAHAHAFDPYDAGDLKYTDRRVRVTP
jgi:hypothetical protein